MSRNPPKPGAGSRSDEDTPSTDRSYAIGYGKPPAQHRFKPGESGNLRGRPRRSQTLDGVYAAMLSSTVPMVIDGKRRRVTMLEAMALRSKKDLLSGSPRTIERWLAFARQVGPAPKELVEHEIDFDAMTDEQLRAIASIRLRPGTR